MPQGSCNRPVAAVGERFVAALMLRAVECRDLLRKVATNNESRRVREVSAELLGK
jgi:hypothetical protein